MTNDAGARLREMVRSAGEKLRGLSEAEVSATRGADGWSRKQELGHLIDSATHNRVRFIYAALDGSYTGANYEGPAWVNLGGYADGRWSDLVEHWVRLNIALAIVIDRIPFDKMEAPCKIGNLEAVSLGFLIEDYLKHAQHHLDHMLVV